jgi:hypothetical protein
MKVQRKWIEDNSVNGQKARLDNDQYLRARNASDSGDVNILKVNGANQIEFASLPQAPGNASGANDLVNLQYLQQYVAGIRTPKDAVRVAAPINISLASPGATIDGVTLVVGDRILLANQTLPAQNGIYIFNGASSALTRSTDADESVEVHEGLSVVSVEGTVNAQKQWVLTTQDPITVGTTALTFVSFPAQAVYTDGDMIKMLGNIFSIDLAAISGLESTNPGNTAGQLRIRVDDATLQKDKTTAISPSNALVGLKARKQVFSLVSADISNGYVDLDQIGHESSLRVWPSGGPEQIEGVDYSINYTGGAASKTRVTFAGDLQSLLAAGDTLYVAYQYL